MTSLGRVDFSDTDYFTAQAFVEAQFYIRLRRSRSRNIEQSEGKGMMLECPSCGRLWRSQGWDEPDSTIAQEYCTFDCYHKAHPLIIPGMDGLEPVETKVDGDNFYTDNPDFLEIH